MPLFTILSSISRELLDAIFFDYRFLPVYIFIALIIRLKYQRYLEFESNVYGQPLRTPRGIIEEMLFTGLSAGFVKSIVVVLLKITLDIRVFEYMLVILVILALINARYACMSYAGGILALLAVFFRLSNVDVPSVLILVAVLHMLESILIFVSGSKDPIPVYIKHSDGITGAFLMRKFWPVPVVFLTFLSGDAAGSEAVYKGAFALGMDCIIGMLGYSDMAVTKRPEDKSRESAVRFFCYSVLLLAIGIMSARYTAFKVIGAVFSVLAHEAVVLFNRYCERSGEPAYTPVKRGLRVLDVLPGSHAFKMGIKRGDIILGINGRAIQTEDGMKAALKDFPAFLWIDILDINGLAKTYEYRCYPEGLNELGLVTIPREKEITYNIENFDDLVILKNLVARFRSINKPV